VSLLTYLLTYNCTAFQCQGSEVQKSNHVAPPTGRLGVTDATPLISSCQSNVTTEMIVKRCWSRKRRSRQNVLRLCFTSIGPNQMQAIATNISVALCVSQFVTHLHRAKTAERIEVLFGVQAPGAQGTWCPNRLTARAKGQLVPNSKR